MALSEILTPHNYTFDENCHVDTQALHPVTLESLERTNHAYVQDRGRYVRETYAALRRTLDDLPLAHYRKAGDSLTDIMMVFNPFGTPIFPRHSADAMAAYVDNRKATELPEGIEPNDANKLFQGRFLYDTLREAGVTDQEGLPLSVVYFSAPSLDHTSPITFKERWAIARGDLSPMAQRPLEYVRRAGYRRLYVAGYSLGAIAAGAVRLAENRDIKVLAGCYVGDSPNFKNRHPLRPIPLGIMLPYMLDSLGSGYEGSWIADGPEPRLDIARNGESYNAAGHWFGNGNFLTNLAIGKSLSRKVLPATLEYMNRQQIPTAISWSESKLMKGFEKFINKDASAEELALNGMLALFCARNAPHISGENSVFLTDMMLRSVLFAQAHHSNS